MKSCQGMGVEKVRKDDTARTFEFLFRFGRVWINGRLLLLLFIAPFLEQLEDMSSPAIVSHNLKELLRIHILKAFKNLKDLNQIRSQKPGLHGSETQYPFLSLSLYYRVPLQSSTIFVALLCTFSNLSMSFL